MDDLQRNLKLASYLGYRQMEPEPIGEFNGVTTYWFPNDMRVDVNYDSNNKPHYYWKGLEIPKDQVGLAHYDPRRSSGRYPAYQWLFKQKNREGCRKHLERQLAKMDISDDKRKKYKEAIDRFMSE